MTIWKRFNLVSLLLALIVTGGGYGVWTFYTAKFRAQARLQVLSQRPIVLFRTVETETENNYKRYQKTQQTLVKSRLVINVALLDGNVSKYRMVREQSDPIAWLQDNLEVEFVGDSEVMEIALSGDDPVELAGLVNAVKKAYMGEVVNVDTRRRSDRHEQLKKIKEKYQEILKERRRRYGNFPSP